MIHSLEIAAYFILFFLDSLKLKGRRHGRCCEEQCVGRRRADEEEKRWKYYQVEAELTARQRGCSAGISTMGKGLCRRFGKDVFEALKCN